MRLHRVPDPVTLMVYLREGVDPVAIDDAADTLDGLGVGIVIASDWWTVILVGSAPDVQFVAEALEPLLVGVTPGEA